MVERRDYYRYELKDGLETVYIGITKDPDRAEERHRKEGKQFTHMRLAGPAVTRSLAEAWMEESIEVFRRGHGGKYPRYNEILA